MTEPNVYAVLPKARGGGEQMHLLVVWYRQHERSRGRIRPRDTTQTLCGQYAATHWASCREGDQLKRVRFHVPIADALAFRTATPAKPDALFMATDLRATWTWCPICVGRYLQHTRNLANALETFAPNAQEAN